MTTPGTVAGQMPMPTKVGAGASRDGSAKSDSSAAPAEGESGFGEVLTKLQRDAGPTTGAILGDAGQEADPQRGVDDVADLASIDAVLDNLSGGDQRPDATQEGAPAANPINDIIAAVGLAPIQPAPARQPEGGGPKEQQAQGSQAAGKIALIDETVGNGSPDPADATVVATPPEAPATQSLAAAMDPALARASARGASVDKGRSERKSSDPLDASPASTTTFSAVVQPRDDKVDSSPPPTANVVRQEVHFAPVSSDQPRARTAEQELGKGTTASEKPDGDAATATASSVDALLPSTEDMQPSVASPGQQIAERILTEAAAAPEFADRAGMTTGQPGMKPALKVLHIQLQPADMGTVTVRMELKDAELSLQVEADRAQTVELLRNDQDTLSGLLRSAGYNVDQGSVRVVEIDRSAASQQSGQNGAQSSFQSPSQSQSGASGRQEHQRSGSTGANGTDAASQTTRNDAHETNTDRAGRGLYL